MLRRTAAVSALLLALTACGGDPDADREPTTAPSTSSATPTTPAPTTLSPTTPAPTTPTTPSPAPPPPSPTGNSAVGGDGTVHENCRPEPGAALLMRPLRVVRPMLIEDIGVFPGDILVRGAWVARTPAGTADRVAVVGWPGGFPAAEQRRYGWDDRTEAVREHLVEGRYHLFVVLELKSGDVLEKLDLAWSDGSATGSLDLPTRVTVGNCG